MPEYLVFSGSLVMVVAVAGKLKEHDASHFKIAVPGVFGQQKHISLSEAAPSQISRTCPQACFNEPIA